MIITNYLYYNVMKKTFMFFLFLWIGVQCCLAQQNNNSSEQTKFDYSQYVLDTGTYSYELLDVTVTNDVVWVSIVVNPRKKGAIQFSSSIFIEGKGFREKAGVIYDGSDQEQLNFDQFYLLEKKQKIGVQIGFRAIPVGVDRISFRDPNVGTFNSIPVYNPDTSIHTDWDEQTLRAYWQKNGMSDNEGIYDFFECNDMQWWGNNKFTVAIKKENPDYQIIYLKGTQDTPFWKEGDVKAIMKSTAVPNLFKASWFMDSKRTNDNFFITFDAATMEIKEKEQNINITFLKMFPSANHYTTKKPHDREQQPENGEAEYTSSGSGIIISTDGVVVTNYHVIEDAKLLDVVIKDNRKVLTYKAKVLATDKTNDLALLVIDDDKFTRFDDIPFALKSTTSEVGTSVFAMGYPLTSYMGEEVKITDGIISSKTGYEGDIVTYQISAPIQPGNSGGPLFDKRGNLIGITNAGIMEANNVGYAIKASYLRNLIESAPISIEIPTTNSLQDLELPEQIKRLSKFVTYIKVK